MINNIEYGNRETFWRELMNIVTISINGNEYKLKGEESTEYLNDIAREVDERIREMLNSNKNFTLQSSAVLLAINYCDQIRKLKNKEMDLNDSIDKCNFKIQELIDENNNLKNEIIHIENKNQEIELQNKRLEEEIQAYNLLIEEDKDNIFSENNEMQELENEIEILKDTLKRVNEENLKLKNEIKNKNVVKSF